MTASKITHYCLGNGERGCDGCRQEKNWQKLNELSDQEFEAAKMSAERIKDFECIMAGRPWHANYTPVPSS